MSERRAAPEAYPPEQHILRDLGIWTEMQGEASRAGLVVTELMLGGGGCLSTGVLAILVDVVAGGAALGLAAGGWIATSDLGLHWIAPVVTGPVEARSRVLRVGKTTIVLEVTALQGERTLALATLGFSRLEAQSDYQRGIQLGEGSPERFSFANEQSGLRAHFCQAAGFELAEKARGLLELPVRGYVGNSLGAIQGGIVAALAGYSAECAAEVAHPGDVHAKDLELHFLALGRVGPLCAEARFVREDAGGSVLRVEIVDTGNEGRLCAVATVTVGPFEAAD